MEVTRKIGAVVVMVLTAIGFVVALGGCVAAWSYKDDVTLAVTNGLETAVKVATLGERASGQSAVVVGQVGSGLSSARDGLAEGVANRQQAIANLQGAVSERYGPTIERVILTVEATRDAIVSFNNTLESVNRIPGIEVPTLTEELEQAQAQINDVEQRMASIRQAVDDKLPDGTPIQDAVGTAADRANTAAASLESYSSRLGTAAAEAAALQQSFPQTLNRIVWLLTLLLLLFAAGQVSLFIHALGWFQRPAAKPTA